MWAATLPLSWLRMEIVQYADAVDRKGVIGSRGNWDGVEGYPDECHDYHESANFP
jgi:hypothetical protein